MNKPLSSFNCLMVASWLFVQMLILGCCSAKSEPRERISIDDDWRFIKGDPTNGSLSLTYDVRREKAIRQG